MALAISVFMIALSLASVSATRGLTDHIEFGRSVPSLSSKRKGKSKSASSYKLRRSKGKGMSQLVKLNIDEME